ncbi:MAG TPA: DUF2141 domain-containing protein [Croceibacterium sp.]|nr:DUF2141 domain-containing protein [Croceibacterium sp.]
MRRRQTAARALVAAASLVVLGAADTTSSLTVELANVRNQRGLLHLCLTNAPAHFPDCEADPDAVKATIRASVREVSLPAVEPGTYALAVIHDENGNGRLDTTLGIPNEGFGFSRNPAIGFGPPSFDRVRFPAEAGASRQVVRLRYLL